jgi:hypothetical protein
MRRVLNASWPRRTLGWDTAVQRWNRRPVLSVDRGALRQQVVQLALSLRRSTSTPLTPRSPAWRRAIELTLTRLGFLNKFSRGERYDFSIS